MSTYSQSTMGGFSPRNTGPVVTPIHGLSISTMAVRMQRGEERRLASRGRSSDMDMYGSPRSRSIRMRESTKGDPNNLMLSRGRDETITMRSTASFAAKETGLSPLLAAETLCSGNAIVAAATLCSSNSFYNSYTRLLLAT